MNQGLAWVVATLFAILPLAHVPALRNLLSLAAGILITALLMRERRMPPLPAFPMAAWIALGTASALWSADPAATLHGVLYDMLLPAGVFLAAWRVAANDRAFDRVRWAAAVGVLCLAAVAAWGAFDYASRERHLELSGDLRLQAWREWTGIALEKPLLGHGFGRSLLRREGQRGVSQELRQRAPHYLSHGHNLFLDVAVQLGVLGLAIYLALLAALLREYWRLGGAAAPRPVRAIGAAGFSLLIAMLVKNGADDFMGQAVAIAFWGYAGVLIGRLVPKSRS